MAGRSLHGGSLRESFTHIRYKWFNYILVRMQRTSFGYPLSVPHAVFCGGRTQWVVPKRRPLHAPTAVGGTANGTRWSTVGTLNMGTWAGTATGESLHIGLGH